MNRISFSMLIATVLTVGCGEEMPALDLGVVDGVSTSSRRPISMFLATDGGADNGASADVVGADGVDLGVDAPTADATASDVAIDLTSAPDADPPSPDAPDAPVDVVVQVDASVDMQVDASTLDLQPDIQPDVQPDVQPDYPPVASTLSCAGHYPDGTYVREDVPEVRLATDFGGDYAIAIYSRLLSFYENQPLSVDSPYVVCGPDTQAPTYCDPTPPNSTGGATITGVDAFGRADGTGPPTFVADFSGARQLTSGAIVDVHCVGVAPIVTFN